MPTLLDNIMEKHVGPEPRVLLVDVQSILRQVIRPDVEDAGESVASIAERSGYSTRTIYRILKPEKNKTDMELDVADKVVMACGSHLAHCRLVFADGRITDYTHLED